MINVCTSAARLSGELLTNVANAGAEFVCLIVIQEVPI